MMNRRELLIAGTGLAGAMFLPTGTQPAAIANVGPDLSPPAIPPAANPIDRKAVVARHSPVVQTLDPYSALTVGNGTFAFTADATGLQTFHNLYANDFPLCTCAHWAWHTTPIPSVLHPEDFKFRQYDVHGKQVGYATDSKGQQPLFDWLRQNPHRLHLGRVGLLLTKADGSTAAASDIKAIIQKLDLWSGKITSQFEFAGQAVNVQTCCHPTQDTLAVRIESDLVDSAVVGSAKLQVQIAFPYASPEVDMADWNSVERHQTHCDTLKNKAVFSRTLDQDHYVATLEFNAGKLERETAHDYVLSGTGRVLEIVIRFSASIVPESLPTFEQTLQTSANYWQLFWSTGGAIDLSQATDPRASELERRIVLSQYNTALHCAGSMPPPETGLLFNSWYGKSHLEMHWWHGVHFATWGRFPLFARSLEYYHRIFPVAKATALRQGYDGVRWPKMVDADGHDAPSPIGPLLIWQQPHPIYYAQLCYLHNPTIETLQHWQEIVLETAQFMASYAVLENGRYVLGPPLKTVSENADTHTTTNPTFELTYWHFGLKTAQRWRLLLGLAPDPKWADILDHLSPLPVQEGCYLMQEKMTDTYTTWAWEHPALLGALGVLPGDIVDRSTMRSTLKKVMQVWDWDRCWGWDFPMTALTAARLGEGELAVQALMIDSPKNHYHPNGHVYQRPHLTAYLPANGGLLAAVAMMALMPDGFPQTGQWTFRSEGLSPLLTE